MAILLKLTKMKNRKNDGCRVRVSPATRFIDPSIA